MIPIENENIEKINGKFVANCKCKKSCTFSSKFAALRMLERGTCENCKKDYRVVNEDINIHKNSEGKWCKNCSGCGKGQCYTRLSHARQSHISDWQCKKCVAKLKRFSNNSPVGDEKRAYNKFKKSAHNRGIEWELSIEDMFSSYNGKCNLTNWDIHLNYSNMTASLDRIDNSKGYSKDNVQWIHTMVNMSKNRYNQELFIEMCKAVANNINLKNDSRTI